MNYVQLIVFALLLMFFGSYALKASADEMPPEPPIQYMVNFEINEVPNNVSVYYDMNGDGVPDIAYAHPILKSAPAAECQPLKDEGDRVTLTWGISVLPHKYTISRMPTAFRWLKSAGWQIKYESSCSTCLDE